ncbi:LysR family transcriptional regulator [Silanimonas sp.]|uniref:LysR family transcriptional regulator n=1 Tax=Silanimonas sp. TaxID=1929290 RepID=UPI0022C760AE|nr:LysR family transcriptional regulator [Silanimonas sp.]MCZ8062185.1 LysR family transcriptional regulator [Silanimonas sp.]
MDLKKLRHLVAIADEGGFVKAARRLHMSQPALSRSIQALEAEAGVPLIDRGTRSGGLTPAGAFVLDRARKLLFASGCLDRDLALYRERQLGQLAFGVGPFPAAMFLPNLVQDLRREHAEVRIKLEISHGSNLLQYLRNEKIDFFVSDTRDFATEDDIAIVPLPRQPMGFFVRSGHPITALRTVKAEALVDFGLATVEPPRSARDTVSSAMGVESSSLPVVLECNDLSTLKQAALASNAILCAARVAMVDTVADGRFIALNVKDMPPLHSEMGVASIKGRSASPLVESAIRRIVSMATSVSTSPSEPTSRCKNC